MSNSSSSEEFEKIDSNSSSSQAEETNSRDHWTPINDANGSSSSNNNNNKLLAERMSTAIKDAPKNLHEFYVASHDIFMRVEQLRKTLRTRTSRIPSYYQLTDKEKAELADRARDYTSLLFTHFEALTEEDSNPAGAETIRDLGRIFELSERICFSRNDTIAVSEVREWLNFHWPMYTSAEEVFELDSEDEELVLVDHTDLNNCSDDDDNDKTKEITIHWSLIQRQLLRGNIERAITLLEFCLTKCSSSVQSYLHPLIILLKSKPALPTTSTSPLEVQRHVAAWVEWTRQRKLAHDALEHMEDKKEGADLKVIKVLFDIVCGDAAAIAKASAGSVLERFVGLLVFCEPTRTKAELGTVGDALLLLLQRQEDQTECMDAVTATCFYLLMRDWDYALNAYDDYWLQTHLGHMLTTATLLEDDDTTASSDGDYEESTTPVQFITHIYAQDIANKHDMWLQAVDYIGSCTTNREYWATKLLYKRITTSDMDTLIDLLELCSRQQLRKPMLLLYKTLAEKYDAKGDEQNAIKYYAKAQDTSSLDRIADRALLRYLNDDVLDDLTPKEMDVLEQATKSKRFAFLLEYTRFRKHLEEHRYAEATEAVKALQRSLDAPEGFKIKLIEDIIPILDASPDTVFFNPQDTLDMIKHLQCIEHVDASTFSNLRQRLSLNLAHALLLVS